MPDKRARQRRSLIFYPTIRDRDTDRTLGRLADLTTEGMRVIGKNRLELGRCYRVELVLPMGDGAEHAIQVQAECVWSGPDVNPDINASGLRFEWAGDQIRNAIEEAITRYGFTDLPADRLRNGR